MVEINTKLIIYALVGGFLPAFVWLYFWLREDKRRPEPIRLIMRTFLFGGLFVFLSFIIQKIVLPFIIEPDIFMGHLYNPSWTTAFALATLPVFLVWAFVEELVKYLAASIAAFSNKNFDEPIDAMVYMITAAIGFAALENSLFLFQSLTSGDNLFFIMTGNLRFLGATIVHVVSSAIIGASLSLSYCSRFFTKAAYFITALIMATVLHALFNFFIIISDDIQMLKIFFILWLGAIFVIYLFEKVRIITCAPAFKRIKNNETNNL